MRTKIFIISLFLFLFFELSKPQDIIECATQIPPGVTIQQAKSYNLNLYRRETMTPPLRLAIHIVRDSLGQRGITMERLLKMIDSLNYYMAQANFQFYIYKIDTIDNSYFAFMDTNKINQLTTINSIDGCINVYFVPEATFNGWASFSPRMLHSDPPLVVGEHGIIVKNNAPFTTLPHEMGHYFDLLHTFHIWRQLEYDTIRVEIYENIERVGSCRNCYNAGDLLCDTPADPTGRIGKVPIDFDCKWRTNLLYPPDHCGNTNYSPLTNNLMIVFAADCRTSFTQEQKNRMNETLLLYRKNLLKKNLVYLENRINNKNAGGSLRVDTMNYKSGKYVPLQNGNYLIGTNNERFSSFQGSGITYKHNNWNNNKWDFLLSRNVQIDTHSVQIANFIKLEPSKITVNLEGQLINNKGVGSFQDPWYVKADGSQPGNYWIPFVSSYEPTGKEDAQEKGVFLNQDYRVPGQPYYSVGAISPQQITINGRTHNFHFQNWSADPPSSAEFQNAEALQTPVVLKKS